jgi:hypothetical protein
VRSSRLFATKPQSLNAKTRLVPGECMGSLPLLLGI